MDITKQSAAIICLSTIMLWAFGAEFQTFRFTSLEESYIFLFDSDYAANTLLCPGGLAQYSASFLSQFFIFPAVGPIISALIYASIMICMYLSAPAPRKTWESALAILPCVLLMLCLENTNYKYQGHVALALAALCVWAFTKVRHKVIAAPTICLLAYIAAGSAAIYTGVCIVIISAKNREVLTSILAAVASAALPYAGYFCGYYFSLAQAYTPAMYYDWNSTYYMMLYALCSLPVYSFLSCLAPQSQKHTLIYTTGVYAFMAALTLWIYGKVHNPANYEIHKMRHYANTEQWEKIADMPYNGTPTPFTSYRFLALAKLERLSAEIRHYSPFINYYFENKPVTKKEQSQVYSDIYYQCHYIAAARHAAFDTDITTPGAFNPYETKKLAEIYIAQGNYELARKTISKLEKTLFHSSEAIRLNALLDNENAVAEDPRIGAMRKAIPTESGYISPKSLARDLQRVLDSDTRQVCAREFMRAFKILTSQH